MLVCRSFQLLVQFYIMYTFSRRLVIPRIPRNILRQLHLSQKFSARCGMALNCQLNTSLKCFLLLYLLFILNAKCYLTTILLLPFYSLHVRAKLNKSHWAQNSLEVAHYDRVFACAIFSPSCNELECK